MISKIITFLAIAVVILYLLGESSPEDPSLYPNSNANYKKLNSEVGCDSKYSDDKRDDIFNSRYKNHWMTWRGEVVLAEADQASLNIDGWGTQDLAIDFSDNSAGYHLKIGQFITVKFVMDSMGGCFLPFGGTNGTIIKQ